VQVIYHIVQWSGGRLQSECSPCIFLAIFQNLSGGTEENNRKAGEDILHQGQDSNHELSKYKPEALFIIARIWTKFVIY
jgi:hypothetical protein